MSPAKRMLVVALPILILVAVLAISVYLNMNPY